jgi:hypothetical protein
MGLTIKNPTTEMLFRYAFIVLPATGAAISQRDPKAMPIN